MNFDKAKTRGEKSAQKLMEKAEDCLDLGKDLHMASDQQHITADKKQDTVHEQHDNAAKIDAKADKLDTVGEALIADAIEVTGEFAMDAERPRFRKQLNIEGLPTTSRTRVAGCSGALKNSK